MRIAIEALGIDSPGGGRAATLNLLKPLLALDDRNEYVIYLTEPEPSLAGINPRARQVIVSIRNRFVARMFLQLTLPLTCRRRGIDLVHFVKNQTVMATGARSVVTVYDLTTLRHPEAYPAIDGWYWRQILPRQYRKMDRLIAISEATAADLVRYYQLPPDLISVIHCGYDPIYRLADPEHVERALQQYGLQGVDYFIHVGNLSLKKNLAVLLEAFLDFRRRTGFPGRLVLVGAQYSKGRDDRFFEILSRPEARAAVLLTGHVPPDELVGLYGGATAFVFPSLHEGFGLAPVEAMACGAPVIAYAGAGAVREVVGGAGLLVESATSVEEWSRALERFATEPSLRAEMRRSGLERAAEFSAERSALMTLGLYEEVASANRAVGQRESAAS
jgi:glycosyltransferase involved in cell wall biosynthesis